MQILVINAGSSSLKANLFKMSKKPTEILDFFVDGIGQENCKFTFKSAGKNIGQSEKIANHQKAIALLFKWLDKKEVDAIGHRVVHGGEKYQKATKIDARVIKEIDKLSKLAPLHNPINLQGIKACKKLLPRVKQVAIFDTAFHQTIAAKAYLYALPYELYKKENIRRYGFHGTSHQYVANQALKIIKNKKAKVVTCHLGNGSSITASIGGKSIDTSMGLTPLEGIPMGTRSGSIDPAIVLELAKKIGIEPTNILLNKKSGLLGLSEISSDMRDIYQKSLKKDPRALLTIEILSYQIAKYCGSYAAAMNGLDCIVFTGGLGEKAWYVREQVCKHFEFLKLKLDSKANKSNAEKISDSKSSIKVLVIPTNEELQIALESAELLQR